MPPKPVAGVGIELKVEPSGFVVGAGKLDVVDKLDVKDEPVSLFGDGNRILGASLLSEMFSVLKTFSDVEEKSVNPEALLAFTSI